MSEGGAYEDEYKSETIVQDAVLSNALHGKI